MKLVDKQDVIDLIHKDEWMMSLLRSVRTLDLPDWWICAGFVRSKIWDTLHMFEERTVLPDVDVIYFSKKNRNETEEKQLEKILHDMMPTIPWSVKNQARMHLRNNLDPYSSAVDAIEKFPETVTALGVQLDKEDQVHLTAPHGVEDVINMIVHPTPFFKKTEALMDIYLERIRAKNWHKYWYLVRYADDESI